MMIHLRQICLVARELKPAIDDLSHIFGIAPVFEDEAVHRYGLENTLLAVGTQFLEVVAPTEEGTAAGRYLDRRGGDGGYMVITQVESREAQEQVRANAAANDVRVVNERDHGWYRLFQLHPGDMKAAFFSTPWVEGGDTVGRWPFAGDRVWMDKVTADLVTAITGAELQSDDPEALAHHWAAVAGLGVESRGGIPHVAFANAVLRFTEATDGRGAGLGGLDLAVRDRGEVLARAEARGCRTSDTEVMVCGTRFYLDG